MEVTTLPAQSKGNVAIKQDLSLTTTAPLRVEIVKEPSAIYYVLKRTLDVILSFVGIIVLLPIFLAVALYIKLDDGGPIFHFREIIGKNGRRFYALKFRSMIVDADGYLARHPELMRKYQQNMKLMSDPRITRAGRFLRKTSLDELPQLLNVLRAYPNNPVARKAIKPQAKWRNAR